MTLMCVKCWETEVIKLHLDDMATFECDACAERFTCEDVEKVLDAMKGWKKVVHWLETAPTGDETA